MKALYPLWRGMALVWWKRALAELTRKNPCHPDINEIVHRINQLERSA